MSELVFDWKTTTADTAVAHAGSPKDGGTRWLQSCLVTALVLTGAALPASADELKFAKLPSFKAVQVLRFHAGKIRFRIPGPPERLLEKPIVELEYLQITGSGHLNHAEDFVAGGKDRKAIPGYQRALKRTNTDWRQSLIRVRLLQASDRAGRFDLATASYVRLLDEIGVAAVTLRPVNFPRRGSRYLMVATRTVNQALIEATDADVADALEALKRKIDQVVNPTAGKDSTRPTGRPVETTPRPATVSTPPPATSPAMQRAEADMFASIDADLAAARYAAAQGRLTAAERIVSPAGLPTIGRLKAQLTLATAEKREHLLDAGLAAMRVIVRFPNSPEVPACLYMTGIVHERIGRPDLAETLLRECKTHPMTPPALIHRVKDALTRVSDER